LHGAQSQDGPITVPLSKVFFSALQEHTQVGGCQEYQAVTLLRSFFKTSHFLSHGRLFNGRLYVKETERENVYGPMMKRALALIMA
jgi:hypothetical protein